MSEKHEKYGNYYGLLVPVDLNKDLCYSHFQVEESLSFFKELLSIGVKNLMLDIEDDDEYSDTLFFEVDENTDMNELLVLVSNMRPNEFSEETENCFRMWFD